MRQRDRIIAGNWKMYKTASQALELVQELGDKAAGLDAIEIVVCPPFTALESVAAYSRSEKPNFKLGAQNMHWSDQGAFTGEVSPVMLSDLGVEYVIIGHSERRENFAETDEMARLKIKAAFNHGLRPILCVGEPLDQREAGQTASYVGNQVNRALEGLDEDECRGLVIAYEPIWAIGTGRTAEPQDANDVVRHLRAVLAAKYDVDLATVIPILYGGSVKPENIGAFMKEPEIDGALVGGASLDPAGFAEIAKRSLLG